MMKLSKLFWVLLMSLVLVNNNNNIFAEDAPELEKIIQRVSIDGHKTVNENMIFARIKSKVGKVYSKEDIDGDIKRLYELGYFSKISVDVDETLDGINLIYIVVEKPKITEILMEGNKKYTTKRFLKKIKTKVGQILNEAQLVADKAIILDYYQSKGYEAAEVSYMTQIDEASASALVTFKIVEHKKSKIKDITVAGNQAVKRRKILKVMKTKKHGFFRRGIFKEDQFDDDLNRVLNLYRSQGYIDAEITTHDVKRMPSGDIFIDIAVVEGSQYQVGKVTIEGNEKYSAKPIIKRIPLKPGDIFTPDGFKKSRSAVQDYYMAKGYIDVVIKASSILDSETGRLNLNFAITENDISYMSELKITGNTKTKDIVIRRELNVSPGQVFNGVKVRRSQERLLNTGFFQKVEMDIEPTDKPNFKDLIISVEENKTGELGFGVGFSSIDNLIGFVEITQKNFDLFNWPHFTGDGQKLRFKSTFGAKRQDVVLSFTEPWFLDRPLSLGFDAYRRESRFLSDVYDETRTGFDVRLGKRLAEFLRGDTTYRLEESEISGIEDKASDLIKAEEGEKTVSSQEFALTYDTRDNIFLTTKGMRHRLTAEYAGGILGFDRDYWKLQSRHSIYFSLPWNTILRMSGQAGVVDVHGDSETVSIFDRFFLGGANTIRGFDFRDVGPKDDTGEPIGGQSMFNGSVEYSFPIIEKVRGAVFYDFGNVYSDFGDFDFGEIRMGVGVGLRLELPIGPVRLDWGYPIDRDEFTDAKGRFDFNIGYSF